MLFQEDPEPHINQPVPLTVIPSMQGMQGMRRQRRWLPALFVALTVIIMAGCASPASSGASTSRGSGTSQTSGAPGFASFSDWRVAYIGQDGDLHVISLDGKTDLVGPHLTTNGPQGTGVWTAGTSPDGEHLAYSGEGVEYIDVHQDLVTPLPMRRAAILGTFVWSPNGHAVVVDGPIKGGAVVQLPSGIITPAPANNIDTTGKPIVGVPYGWLNNTSLAVENASVEDQSAGSGRVPTPQTVAGLARMDITSGQVQPIATIRSSTMGGGQFSLTPDGKEALFFNAAFENFPFTPSVERIDTATGQATPLPHLTSISPASGGFTQVLWLPHTHMALIATGFPQNHNLAYQIIDIDQDSASPLTITGFPVAWSPDGKTLILASSDQTSNENGVGFRDEGMIGSGPYTLTALTFDTTWHAVNTVTLTTHAMEIPTLGFVRNP